ncbi:MAG TPA: arginine deiminase-related protein [Vicinamibacterales bacterium]|nr:arginine deiminase-related protein [Vicinamibacterales bacterium]
MRAIVRVPSAAISRCALTFLQRTPIDFERALQQHAAYVEALERAGVEVRILSADPDLPDAVFVEDTAVVMDECAVVTRPGIESRRGEVDTVAAALEPIRPTSRITAPGTIEGGDVLRVGRTFFVGQTPRTNAEGTRQFAAIVEPHGYAVVPVSPIGCLHLKSAVTYIGDETVLVNPEWIDVDHFRNWQCVPVAPEEPSGANALLTGSTVFVAASAPQTRRKLDALGFTTAVLDTSEFEKAEAALTCLSLLFE